MSREKKTYDEEFKLHIVELCKSGRTQSEVAEEYNLSRSSISDWVKRYKISGEFKAGSNLTAEQKEIKNLEKALKDKQMEIDILKKAMVIMSKD